MIPLGYVPIPWSSLLDSCERHLLTPPCFQPVCCTPLSFRGRGYTGDPMMVLHCHCNKPYSLECWARAAWLRSILHRYVGSMNFNSLVPMYRGLVNSRLAGDWLMYLGSSMACGGHFIYVSLSCEVYMARLVRAVHQEPTRFGLPFMFFLDATGRNNTIILKCRWCVEFGQSWTACADRLARVLQRMCRFLGATHHECGYQYGAMERSGGFDVYRHDRDVERYHRYGIPIRDYRAFYPYFYISRRFDSPSSSDTEESDDSGVDNP